jgi:Tfp pilus assembly protein PilF
MRAYRQAIALDGTYAPPHNNLALLLLAHRRWDEAMAEYRQAIALDPTAAEPHGNLGSALRASGRWEEAIVEYRQAIALAPKDGAAHYNLANLLLTRGRTEEAVTAYRQAVQLNPDLAEAHCNLGHALLSQGRLDEALIFYKRGHELGTKQADWRYPSREWVRQTERLIQLKKKMPAILHGEASPANPSEAISLAWMCRQPDTKQYAASARLYSEAFTADPKLTADMKQQHRYNAACSAALAAAGQGEDARLLPDKTAIMFHHWALGWMRDDLTVYAKLAGQNNPALRQEIQRRLTHWRGDPDLASVRDAQALDRLPDHERASWQALWRDADELAKRLATANKAGENPQKGEKVAKPKKNANP